MEDVVLGFDQLEGKGNLPEAESTGVYINIGAVKRCFRLRLLLQWIYSLHVICCDDHIQFDHILVNNVVG